jgi:chaperonin cofactor prefoldin
MNDLQQKTLNWISEEIDKINQESVVIGEMLLEESNIETISILDKKLSDLEKKLDYLHQKFIFEKETYFQ